MPLLLPFFENENVDALFVNKCEKLPFKGTPGLVMRDVQTRLPGCGDEVTQDVLL